MECALQNSSPVRYDSLQVPGDSVVGLLGEHTLRLSHRVGVYQVIYFLPKACFRTADVYAKLSEMNARPLVLTA